MSNLKECLSCKYAERYQSDGLEADCICDPLMGECPADQPKGGNMEPCKAEITFVKDMGDGYPVKRSVTCCLMAPHNGFKHYSPSLLLTCGGNRVEEDATGTDITGTWSPYCNEKTRR